MIDIGKLIKLDRYRNIASSPNLRLMSRGFEVLGNISHYTDWNMSINGNSYDEISFNVTKYNDGVLCPFWDKIVDLKIIDVDNLARFEIQVDYTDDTKTTKSIHGISLEAAELGQLNLYDFHVNDEDELSLDDSLKGEDAYEHNWEYKDGQWKFIPTVFYKKAKPKNSLLDRVLMDKAPHWSIGYVTEGICIDEDDHSKDQYSFNFQRTYTVDGSTIYDFLTGEVAKESNVIFDFDTVNRKINAYCLSDCYLPGLLIPGLGEDTTILVSKEKLASQITVSSNKDSVKNCFRVEGGDELINNMIRAVNLNGSNYIYSFADFQYDDMPNELVTKLQSYQEMMKRDESEYVGEDGIYTRLAEKYSEYNTKKSAMTPEIDISDKYKDKDNPAYWHWQDLKDNLGIIGVNTNTPDVAIATSNLQAMAEVYIDGRYSVEVIKSTCKNLGNNKFKAIVVVTKDSDQTKYYPQMNEDGSYNESDYFEFTMAKDNPSAKEISAFPYTVDKIRKKLAQTEPVLVDLELELDNTDVAQLTEYFNQYCVDMLQEFYDAYDSCHTIITSKTTDITSQIPAKLEEYFRVRLNIVGDILTQKNAELDAIMSEINELQRQQSEFQAQHNLQTYLGDDLYKLFRAYVREDTYANSNFISDGIDDMSQLLAKAKELYEDANKEIRKACMLQRTISVSMNNLLMLPEFEPLFDKFKLFNYIRVKTEDEIFKLRLVAVDYNGENFSDISVTFSDQVETLGGAMSDLQSVLNQASSMSTSYNATMLQAQNGSTAQNTLNDMVANGFNAANMNLKNNNNNEVIINDSGIICRRMDDEGDYGEKQLRLTGNILAFTEDGWETVLTALGEIEYNGEQKYGLIADAIIGNLIAGKNMIITNNEDPSSATVTIDSKGMTIDGGALTMKPGTYISVNDIKASDVNPEVYDLTKSKYESLVPIGGKGIPFTTVHDKGDKITILNGVPIATIPPHETVFHINDLKINTPDYFITDETYIGQDVVPPPAFFDEMVFIIGFTNEDAIELTDNGKLSKTLEIPPSNESQVLYMGLIYKDIPYQYNGYIKVSDFDKNSVTIREFMSKGNLNLDGDIIVTDRIDTGTTQMISIDNFAEYVGNVSDIYNFNYSDIPDLPGNASFESTLMNGDVGIYPGDPTHLISVINLAQGTYMVNCSVYLNSNYPIGRTIHLGLIDLPNGRTLNDIKYYARSTTQVSCHNQVAKLNQVIKLDKATSLTVVCFDTEGDGEFSTTETSSINIIKLV